MMLAAQGLTAQQPFVRFGWPANEESDTLHWHPGAPMWLKVFAGPAGASLSSAQSVEINSIFNNAGEFIVPLLDLQPGISHLCLTATAAGESVSKCLVVVVEEPVLQGGTDQWKGLHAVIGRLYNPSSDWKSTNIPIDHYQTVVLFDGAPVFGRAGTSFTDDDLRWGPLVDEYTQEIETVVYWKPGGTGHDDEWVRIFSSPPSRRSIVPQGKIGFEIRYATPEHTEGFEFDWFPDSSLSPMEFEPIMLRQMIAPYRFIVPVPMEAACGQCPAYGISAQLLPGLESSRLRLDVVDSSKFARVPNGKRFNVEIAMRGRGGAVGSGRVIVTIGAPRSAVSIVDEHAGTSHRASNSEASRSGDFDSAGIEAIRALPWFKVRAVNIYAVEGDALQGMIAMIQAADSADYYDINVIVEDILGPAPGDIGSLAVRDARRSNHFEIFAYRFVNSLQVDFEDTPVEKFQRIYRLALSIIERQDLRPTRFYLVTSSERNPKPIALLGTKRDERGNTMVVPTADSGSMRAIFDGIEKKWFTTLEQSLAVKSPTRDAGGNALLRQVWPEAPQRR